MSAVVASTPAARRLPVRHVEEQLGHEVDMILDGGPANVGVESTIVVFEKNVVVLRPDGLPIEDIEKVVGPVEVRTKIAQPSAPGQLDSRYAPITPLCFVGEIPKDKRVGLLAFK